MTSSLKRKKVIGAISLYDDYVNKSEEELLKLSLYRDNAVYYCIRRIFHNIVNIREYSSIVYYPLYCQEVMTNIRAISLNKQNT